MRAMVTTDGRPVRRRVIVFRLLIPPSIDLLVRSERCEGCTFMINNISSISGRDPGMHERRRAKIVVSRSSWSPYFLLAELSLSR